MDVKETVAVAAAEGAAATALGDDATIVVSTKEMDSAKTIDIAPAEKLKDLTDDLKNNIKENADGIDNLDDEIIEEKASTQNVKAASITSTTETSTTAKAVPIKNGTTSTNADSKLEVSSSAEDANVDDDDANEKVAAVREPPKGDDQLIQELEEIEGLKKVDDATNAAILLETGILDSEMQKTSDLLKDLEGDIQDGQIDDVRNDEQQAEIDDAIKSIVEAKDGTEVDKGGDGNGTDIVGGGVDGNDDNDNNDVDADNDVLVDSTSESNLKRKHSTDEITGNPTKKQNISIDDVSTNTVKDDGKIEQPTTSDKNKANVKMDILQATKDDADCIVGDVANSQPNSTATKEIEAAISSTSNDSCSKMTSKLCEMIENSKTSPDVLHTDAKDGNKLKTDSQEVSSTGEEKTKHEGEIKLVKKSAEEADSSDGKTTKITAAATTSATATADNKMDKYISDSTVSVDSSFDGLFSADSAHCDNGKKATEDVEEKMDVDEDDSILDSKDKDNNKIENKLLKSMMNNGSSTPNTSDTMTSVTTASIAAVATASEASTAETPTVFNSTPIQKEFEISSENVSKISESGEQSQTDKSLTEAIECDMMCSSDDHTADELTIKSSSTGSDVPSESLTRYANVLKKYNGLTDAISEDSSIDQLAEKPSQETNNKSIANGTNLDTTQLTADPNSRVYEIHIMYEDNEMTFMALENVERKKKSSSSLIGSPTTDAVGSDTSGKHSLSTNSSVGSVGPFNLPGNRITPTSSSLSSELSHEKFAVPSNVVLPQQHIKKTIKGMTALCNFMIDHFSQIKKRVDLNDSVDESDHRSMVQHKGRKSAGKKNLNESDSGFDIEAATSATATTPKAGGKRNAQKRSLDKNVSDSEDEPKVKQTKGSKKSSKIDQTPTKHQTTANDESKLELSVLARWVDKKYYAGRITESKPGNKFVVLFEDGASKVLPQESIVFGGEDDILPLLNQSVHALVDEETYEPGLVESTSKDGDIVYYTVIAESKTVKVTSSEIYLEDDQAKVIQSLNLGKMNELLKTPDTPSSTKRAGRPSIKLEESQASPLSVGGGAAGGGGVGGSSSGGGGGSGAGRGRPKKSTTAATTQQQSSTSAMATPEPSTSGTGGSTSGRKGRRAKRYS